VQWETTAASLDHDATLTSSRLGYFLAQNSLFYNYILVLIGDIGTMATTELRPGLTVAA
jgi:hypothetical protein